MPVMSILTSLEQEVYTQPPVFSHVERKRFCDFPTSLLTIAGTLRSPTNRVGFLLSCAYFRATKRFFPVQSFHPYDIEFIAQRWGLSPQQIDLQRYNKQTRIPALSNARERMSHARVPIMVPSPSAEPRPRSQPVKVRGARGPTNPSKKPSLPSRLP